MKYIFPHLNISTKNVAKRIAAKVNQQQEQRQQRLEAEKEKEREKEEEEDGGAIPSSEGGEGRRRQQQEQEKEESGEEEQEEEDELLIIPTIQKSRVDTVRFGVEVEEEKDRCLEHVRVCGFPVSLFIPLPLSPSGRFPRLVILSPLSPSLPYTHIHTHSSHAAR